MSSQLPTTKKYETAHDSHYVYMIIKKRVVKSALPNLGQRKGKSEILFVIILIILAAFGGTMTGFQLDIQVINPPLTVIGVCQPPAVISGNGCFIISQSVDSSGKTTTVRTPAGSFYFPNGSSYAP